MFFKHQRVHGRRLGRVSAILARHGEHVIARRSGGGSLSNCEVQVGSSADFLPHVSGSEGGFDAVRESLGGRTAGAYWGENVRTTESRYPFAGDVGTSYTDLNRLLEGNKSDRLSVPIMY